MSPLAGRLSVRDWEAELNRQRTQRPAEPRLLAALQLRFRDVCARIRAHRRSDWIDRLEYGPLRALSDQTLELTRLAQQEFACHADANAATVHWDLLQRLLADIHHRLGEIDSQFGIVQSSLLAADLLRPTVEALLAADSAPRNTCLTNVVDFFVSLKSSETLLAIVPIGGLSLERILASVPVPLPWFYAPAIHRARWTAALWRHLPELQLYPLDALLTAALLADVGQASLAGSDPRFRRGPPAPGSAEDRRHPEISAALVSGMEASSPLATQLVGQHHERLNGGGYPQRFIASALREPMRSFTAIVRWSELMQQATTATTPFDVAACAATCLWKETLQGAFDVQTVTQLLAAVQPDLPVAVKDAVSSGAKFAFHPAQPLHGPHAPTTAAQAATVRFSAANQPVARGPHDATAGSPLPLNHAARLAPSPRLVRTGT